MFDCTQAAVRQTLDDLKKLFYYVGLAMQIVYIAYLVYAIVAGSGILVVNILLCALCVAYFVFWLIVTKVGKDPDAKHCAHLKKGGREAFKWSKRAIRLVTIGSSLYEIFSVETAAPLNVLFAAFMIIGWVLEFVFDLIVKIVNARFQYIMEGVEVDVDDLLRPIRNTANFFKKMTGQEVEPPKELTKNQLSLKEKAAAYREEKAQQRKDRREVYKQRLADEKEERRQRKKDLKASTKAEKALLKAAAKKKKVD